MRMIPTYIALVLGLAASYIIPRPAPPSELHVCTVITQREYQVTRVIDGDTFQIIYDGMPTSVRVLGIDTPERGESGHDEATEALRSMIDGHRVTIHFQPQGRKRDHFGRLLCSVSTEQVDDISRAMLDRGLAKPYQPSRRAR